MAGNQQAISALKWAYKRYGKNSKQTKEGQMQQSKGKKGKKGKKGADNAYRYPDPKHNYEMKIKHARYFEDQLKVPKKDAEKAAKVFSMARKLDGKKLGRWRVGPAAVIGFFFPVVGDFADGILASFVLLAATRVSHGLDASVKVRMLLNVGTMVGIGLVPFVGDLADSLYQANTKNAMLLEQMLKDRVENGLYVKWEAEGATKKSKKAAKEGRAPVRDRVPTNGHRHQISEPVPIHDQALTNGHYDSESDPRRNQALTNGYRDQSPAPLRNQAPKNGYRDPQPATKADPDLDERYGGMHERLGMKAKKDSPKKTTASKSGNRWFGRSKSRGQDVTGANIGPARPPRPGNPIYLGDMAGGEDVAPAQPPRRGNSRRVNGGNF